MDQAWIKLQLMFRMHLSRIREQLPDTIKEPQVLKFSTSDKPVVTVSLKSNTTDLREVRQIAEDRIGFEMQLVDGVASVNYFGGNRSEIQVVLDRNRMEAYGLSYDQVNQTLVQNNVKAPGGKVVNRDKGDNCSCRCSLGRSFRLRNLKIQFIRWDHGLFEGCSSGKPIK